MIMIIVLGISILLQFTAAVLALRLIRVTGKRTAWVLIAMAILFMALRRCVALYHFIPGGLLHRLDLSAELIALAISALMLAGVASIAPLFFYIKRSQEMLKKSESKYRFLYEGSPAINLTIGMDGLIKGLNKTAQDILGYSKDEIIDKEALSFVIPAHREKVAAQLERDFKGEHTPEIDVDVYTKDGSMHTILLSPGQAVLSEEDKPTSILVIGIDITERRRAEEHIQHLNSVLKAIRTVNQLIVVDKDRDSLLQKACDALIETRSYDAAWLGFLSDDKTFATVKSSGFREDLSRFHEHMMGKDHPFCVKSALAQKDPFIVVDKSVVCGGCFFKSACAGNEVAIIRVEHADRLFGLLAISLAPDVAIDDEEKVLLKEIADDIALALHAMEMEEERKRAEEKIKTSLQEKEVLLREIHHRVKNNLQVITSLINFQARSLKDKKGVELLKELQNRIRSMSLVHEKLYRSQDLVHVSFKEYIQDLVKVLYRAHGVDKGKIALKIAVKDVSLGIDVAIPCGLIINELVSNALKHAFPEGQEGKIKISLHPTDKSEVELVVSDNGVGIPEDVDFRKTESLGLHIVTILAEDQLHGKVELDRTKGTEFKIRMKVK